MRGEYEFHQAENSPAAEVYDRADAFYRQALARDANFAEAAAELARSRLRRHFQVSPLAPAELEEVKLLIDRALALAPNSPDAHLALGVFFYLGHRQYENALTEFNRALELQPNNALARQYCAYVYRRRGEWERALADLEQAQQLDPRDSTILAETGSTYLTLRMIERRFTDAFQAFEKQVAKNDLEHLRQLAGRVVLRVLAGETEAAKSAGEEARSLLEARLRERPDDTFAMTGLSWVYLALGRNADALRVSEQAAHLISIEKDALAGPTFQNGLAQIEARAGAPEEAIKRLRRLLSIPAGGWVSTARLKIDPVWDPIRNRPDFQQLLLGPEQIGPNK